MRLKILCASLLIPAILTVAACGGSTSGSSAKAGKRRPTVSTTILPKGTQFVVQTTSDLSTNSTEGGQTFTATLEQPVLQGDLEIAKKGARVEGKVVDADQGGKIKGVASLSVTLTGVEAEGQFIYISTDPVTFSAGSTKKKDAAEIAIGTGIGAAIGAVAGGGKGAAVGAAAGGAAGTGVVLATRGAAAVIPGESVITFTLNSAVAVSVSR